MAYTTKYSFGLIAALLLSAGAMAQTETNSGSAVLSTAPRQFTVATDDYLEAPIRPALQAVDIDSTTFYEDFRDGLAGWTIERVNPANRDVWKYTRDDSLGRAHGGGFLRNFNSETEANGFAYFTYIAAVSDSGRAALPGQPYPILKQSLVSPYFSTKDLAADGKFALQWTQTLRVLNNRNQGVQFQVKGSDRTEKILATVGVNANTYAPTNALVRVPRSVLAKDSVRVIFTYEGDFYGWAIDDIFLGVLPNTEVSLNANFIAVAPNYRTPVSQTAGQNLYFVTDLQNRGALAQAPKVVVEIYRLTAAGGELYYSDSLQYPSIPSDSVFDNNVFEKFVGLPTEPGQYRAFYDVYTRDAADEDANLTNNSTSYDFFISAADSLVRYNKANILRNGTTPAATFGPGDFELGNIYYTPNLGTQGIRIDSFVTAYYAAGFEDTNDAAFIEMRTYGYKGDVNGDGIPSIGTTANEPDAEFVLLGTRFYSVAPKLESDYYEISGVPGEDADSKPTKILLPPGQGYIGYAIGLSYTQASSRGINGDTLFVGVDNQYQTGNSSLVRDSLARRGLKPLGEYGQYANLRGASADRLRFDNFTVNSLYINSYITVLDSVNLTSVKTELVAKEFTLSPNPASTEVNITFDFGDNTTGVTFKVFNGVGQQVMHLNQPVSASSRITIPVASLNQGVYFVTATAQNGASTTRRILIQR